MTRRITLAILVTVWATLVGGAATAYLTTRQVLIEDLDQSLVARAATLPEVIDDASGSRFTPVGAVRDSDRYLVRNQIGQTLARPTTATAGTAQVQPRLLRAGFSRLPDRTRARTVTIQTMARPLARDGGDADTARDPVPVTVTFTSSCRQLDSLLNRLGLALAGVCVVGAILAAGVARLVASRALRPLRDTADVVGEIDERSLDRRIDSQHLPPELVPVASKINQMLSRLEESLRSRRQFVADASHELRTPVAALVTALEVSLRRPRDPESYRETIRTGLTDARLLQTLVEALLAQVRSELAPPNPQFELIDIGQLIHECVAAVSPLADEKSIAIGVAVPEEMILRTQAPRLRSIVINLVGNAIEHNHPDGQVEIVSERQGQHLLIEVRDTGTGIAPEHLPHLFEPFYRVDSARTSGHLGLGLYLVKTHVQALGGTCEVSSRRGSGSCFRVRLPGLQMPLTPVSTPADKVQVPPG